MLPECPLVPPDRHAAVLTDRRGCFWDPVGGSLPHQFPLRWFNAPSLLVAGQCWCGGNEPSHKAPKQQRLPTQVLRLEVRGASVPGHEIQDRHLGDCFILNS